jgi:gamma-glutamyltranspeptidase/glutathione hydrolase
LKKLAFADRDAWIGDPGSTIPLDRLADPDYLAARAGQLDPTAAASDVESGITRAGGASDAAAGGALALSSAPYSTVPGEIPDDGDTVYLTAVDQWGNAVSWIQSLFNTFGSGLMEPGTGIMLHNRGSLFTLEEGHPNLVAPGKRPFHTLTPLLALRGEEFAFTLGTPGGDAQTQSLLQIVNNLLMFGMTPQEAVEYPRFRSQGGLGVSIEDRIPFGVRNELSVLGHDLTVVPGWTAVFGGAQMILFDPLNRTLVAASDPRREAYGIAY